MKIAGRSLILAGVAVWAVYGLRLASGHSPDVSIYLPLHLAGVIPGACLSRWSWIRRQFVRVRSAVHRR